MTARPTGALMLSGVLVLAACGSSPATGAAATVGDKSPLNNAKAPTTTARPRKTTPECNGVYTMQSLRLALRRPSPDAANQGKLLGEYRTQAETVKKLAPDIAGQIDQRVALTTKATFGTLTAPESQTSDQVDKAINAWWEARCL
ncbi:MAG: hypothetical protein HYX32_02560 [Actinobacteria bacterium]|nr:hypothetical protein [Actinomycetota bacterium]